MHLRTYTPKNRVHVKKEHTVPFLVELSASLESFAANISLFISGFLLSLSTFFKAKTKVREIQSRYEKTLDLR